MMKIVLASHGELAKGILNSVHMIMGEFDKDVEVFCLYPGQNPIDYANELKDRIKTSHDSWIIVADILGGSIHTALSQLTEYGNVTILSGMNLNLILSILLEKYDESTEDCFQSWVEEAKSGITYTKRLPKAIEEEF